MAIMSKLHRLIHVLDYTNFDMVHIRSDELEEARNTLRNAITSIEASSSKDENLSKVLVICLS